MHATAPSRRNAIAKNREQSRLLATAVVRAAAALGLQRRELTPIIGVSESRLSRLAHGKGDLLPDSKEGELSLLFIRLYRSLGSLLGHDAALMRDWLQTDNRTLLGRPVERIRTVSGLVSAVAYLDGMLATL